MAAIKHRRPLQEVWTIVPTDLDAGDTLVVTTAIQLPANPAMTGTDVNRFLAALQDVHVIYKEDARVGAPFVPDPEITATAAGLVVVTMQNTGAPGSQSSGQMLVIKEHTSVQ